MKDPNDLFFDADGNPVLQTLPNGDDGLPGRYVMDNGGMDEVSAVRTVFTPCFKR